ncbi:preATP grasp domain-containing protein [Micromonospora polyrhachis]|uniref:ATP-grasp domain-containing protein n=1 Tax=Micromonospora polyrhachis TaxID=1282883 RepID=A0A7W7SX24_9ACTN|nr:peptide ligase PGM1-related protein [Micromonospora polyrhachis]MBB4962468.1 hypothetical protein [Micromonospora polyrhachis]
MTTLIVGNSRTEEMVGDLTTLSPDDLVSGGCGAQRMLWYARDGDILVLPWLPETAYLNYVTALTGTRLATLTLVVPPPGFLGGDILTPDRLADEGFRDELRTVLTTRRIDQVLAVYTDTAIAELATVLDIEPALPGHRFSAQGGDALVNSKAAFRAMAAGTGVSIAPGTVVTRPEQAEAAINALLGQGYPVMVKQEFHGGGFGNEILATTDALRPAGAPQVVVLPDGPAVTDYVTQRWTWLTGGRGHRLVVERYFADSVTIYAEFVITDEEIELLGVGEILMEPVAVGEIVPAQSIDPQVRDRLVVAGRRLCEPIRGLGYRGNLSTDAILTPEGEIVFSETNGRITGSTHLHAVIGARVVGANHRDHRVIMERGGWQAASFTGALEQLTAAGLAYDPATRTGIILTSCHVPADDTVVYCVVAEDLAAVREYQRRLAALLTGVSV